MRNFSFHAILLAATVSVAPACAPHLQVVHAPHSPAGLGSDGEPRSVEQVEAAVLEGLSRKGWVVLDRIDGQVRAQVSAGAHQATVRVDYSAEAWSIAHEATSAGLKHGVDSQNREVIHLRYNHWIRLLDDAIRQALDERGAMPATAVEPTAESSAEPEDTPNSALGPDEPTRVGVEEQGETGAGD
ncbi:MAG: hypothetical protein B7733_16015 [Myxococcales bacterium FL481]|nr:MAG: hypothetical protein B7733_16015 [Myxococcales bacterium FL481]